MSTVSPVLPDREKNRFINKKLCDDIIPSVYETVINWGCKKGDDETFLEYYLRRPEKLYEDNKEEWEKDVDIQLQNCPKQWSEEKKKKEKEKRLKGIRAAKEKQLIKETWKDEDDRKLNQKNCDGLDATFLHKLAPTICDGFRRYHPDSPSKTNIEKFLKENKDTRNNICHDPKGAAVSMKVADELEVSAVNAFKAAGELYSLDQKIVQDKIDELKNNLENVKKEMMTDDQQRILQRARKLSEDGKDEMHATLQQRNTDYLPLSDRQISRKDVFRSVGLVVKSNHEGDMNKNAAPGNNEPVKTEREMPSDELLEHFEGSNVLIEGEPGTGKTTLLKMIMEDFGAKSTERFRGVRKFDQIMFMACRNNSITTVYQMLEDYMPLTSQPFTEKETIQALYHRKLLILVDGFDELTSNTKPLLEELISKFGRTGNAFIFTSRPGHAQRLQVKYETVIFQAINDEEKQSQFLQQYQEVIDKTKTLELIAAFRSLDETCKAALRHPVHLAMFCALFQKSPDAVKGWKNDLGIMEAFLYLSNETVFNRLTSMRIDNPEYYAEAFTDAVNDLSLCLLHSGKMIITNKIYTAMCRDVFGGIPVNYYAIASSFFARSSDRHTLEVFHKSVIEYLAGKAIFKELCSNNKVSVVATIKTIVKKRTHWMPYDHAFVTDGERVSLKQFENVLRFVCLLLHEVGESGKSALQRFLDEVCPALAEEEMDFSYWTNLVMGCLDSDQVVEVAANAAVNAAVKAAAKRAAKWVVTVSKWEVRSSRDMTATSKMLRYRQPQRLVIEPVATDECCDALTTLLKAVAQWHTGRLLLRLNKSHANYSACDTSLAFLESSQLDLNTFKGCLGGGNNSAWRALVEGARRAGWGGAFLFISLLDPIMHELGELDGTPHDLKITARPPSSHDHRRRRPLPTSTSLPPVLRVECRPAEGGEVPCDEEMAALIEDLAPKDMRYGPSYLLHYPGLDGALDGLVARLRASGVRFSGWEEAERRNYDWQCMGCRDNSRHRPGERCVQLKL